MAPEDDKKKAFSCETSSTVLGVVYDTVLWTWNLGSEKLKGVLHDLYDMLESESVTNALAGHESEWESFTLCSSFPREQMVEEASH